MNDHRKEENRSEFSQATELDHAFLLGGDRMNVGSDAHAIHGAYRIDREAVSYTHLTLPTNREV